MKAAPVPLALFVSVLVASSSADAPSARAPLPALREPAWLVPSASSEIERSIREAMRPSFADPLSRARKLREVAEQAPGTEGSGLARLGAGFVLLENNRPEEALPEFSHPDVGRTALADQALVAIGRAQEALERWPAAAKAYEAATAFAPRPVIACEALDGLGRALDEAGDRTAAIAALERSRRLCPSGEPEALLAIGKLHLALGHPLESAQALDALVYGWPTSKAALSAAPLLARVRSALPARPPGEVLQRDLDLALALVEARRHKEALAVLQGSAFRSLAGPERERHRLLMGRALFGRNKRREAEAALSAVDATSPLAAEASLWLARVRAKRGQGVSVFLDVTTRHPGTAWAAEALLALANHHTADFRHDEALAYWKQLATEYPTSRYADRATWRVAWADFRAGRHEAAATAMEAMLAARPDSPWAPQFLYWSSRSRLALGQTDRARALLEAAVIRFRNTWHGQRALLLLGPGTGTQSAVPPPRIAPVAVSPVPPDADRVVRQLLLLDRLVEAEAELRALPPTRATLSTLSWIESRRGRFRPAITAMRRAYPEYQSVAIEELPLDVQRILYPMAYTDLIQGRATERDLDPALVAALVCQESTFEAGAVSQAGARGLMQIMPATGRRIARERRVPFSVRRLYDPSVSVDFGTFYLKQFFDSYRDARRRCWPPTTPDRTAWTPGPARPPRWGSRSSSRTSPSPRHASTSPPSSRVVSNTVASTALVSHPRPRQQTKDTDGIPNGRSGQQGDSEGKPRRPHRWARPGRAA